MSTCTKGHSQSQKETRRNFNTTCMKTVSLWPIGKLDAVCADLAHLNLALKYSWTNRYTWLLFSAPVQRLESGKCMWHPVSCITRCILAPPLPITCEWSVWATSIFSVTLDDVYIRHQPTFYTIIIYISSVHVHAMCLNKAQLYKLAVTVHRCPRHRAPRYLADYCVPVSEVAGRQYLRSARCHQLSVPQICRNTLGICAFSVARSRVWNSLPDHLRDPAVDPEQFRRELKTYLFAGHSKC